MRVEPLRLKGVKLITGAIQSDLRGDFFKLFSANSFEENGLGFNPVEIFYSFSKNNVIRGMHFQNPPLAQAKLVHVMNGKIVDVILDLRTDSVSYGKFITIDLYAGSGQILYIPSGFAHGFLSKENNSVVLYAVDAPYSQINEDGILYNSFGYDWGVESPILSERDRSFVRFDKFDSLFRV
jgi:dTDP-4-dehydrorhamnose 3,5-epimerase